MSNDNSTAYSKYVPEWERPVLTALTKALLDNGYKLAVYDGEEYVTPKTRKLTTVRPALGGTGEDWLTVFDEDGDRVGYWYLIYHNGSENDPMVVITDYGWSDAHTGAVFDDIWKDLSKRYEA